MDIAADMDVYRYGYLIMMRIHIRIMRWIRNNIKTNTDVDLDTKPMDTT